MDREPRTLLEQLVWDGDHTNDEWCELFKGVARATDPTATMSRRQLQRWMAGKVEKGRASSRRVAGRLWGYPFLVLLGPPRPGAGEGGEGPPVEAVAVSPAELEPAVESYVDQVAAVAIAHESMHHAMSVGGNVEAMNVEQLQAETWRLARSYTALPPITILAEGRRARDLTYLLLEQTRRPHQTRDLYLVAGQLCGLMAAASFDLAAWDASSEQARAAYVYGEMIDHPSLRAWTRGYQALIAYWTGHPQQAVALAASGLRDAPAGSPTTRLQGIAARAWSHVGDADRTRDAITAAEASRAVDRRDDLHDDIGGAFGWGAARHHACVGSALVQIGDGHGAAAQIRTALTLHPNDRAGGLLVERAHCDLANAELVRQDLDAATDALEPVWRLSARRRTEGVTGRLSQTERLLGAKRWQTDRRASSVREQIVMFNAEASARALPAATG